MLLPALWEPGFKLPMLVYLAESFVQKPEPSWSQVRLLAVPFGGSGHLDFP